METGTARVLASPAVVMLSLLIAGLLPGPAGAVTIGCSETALRDAITAANTGTGDTTIVIPASCTITLTGAAGDDGNLEGDLDILAELTIQGAGVNATILDGGGIDRIIHVITGATVAISGLTIRNGNSGSAEGGGILNLGTLTLSNVLVMENTTAASGGGIEHSSGTLTLTDSTVRGNSALTGAGISNDASLTASRSTIAGNSSSAGAGGIGNFGTAATAAFTNTTVTGNTAVGGGGGITNDMGTVTLTNSTIGNNVASGGDGGGGIWNLSGSVTLTNTIVAENSGSPGANCQGTITSAGHNLDSGTSCAFSAAGDLSNADPLLGPLANNAGVTQTHALLDGSPAIDAGTNTGCPAADQRGVKRPLQGSAAGGVTCDIGAYERILVDGGLTLDIALNQASYVPGDTLQMDVTVANPTGPEVPVDVYLGFVLPTSAGPGLGCAAGDAIAFVTAGFAGFQIHCLSDAPSGFPRLFAGTAVPPSLPPTLLDDFFATTVPGAPSGGYTGFLVLTVPNALVDDEVGAEDIIRSDTASFTVP